MDDACDAAADNDGVLDGSDNCPKVRNTDQADLNGNGVGVACDPTEQIKSLRAGPAFRGRLTWRSQLERLSIVVLPEGLRDVPPWPPTSSRFSVHVTSERPVAVQLLDPDGFVVASSPAGTQHRLVTDLRGPWIVERGREARAGAIVRPLNAQPYTLRFHELTRLDGRRGVNLQVEARPVPQ
ncbi:MAG: hypothetical protein ACT4P6_04480 [Gemmatimonadaceae bacterium]